MDEAIKRNITTIYAMGFFHSFIVVIPVYVPLLQGYGLSMSQVLQTQAIFALTIALCEVPSGYLADLWGRRRALLVGAAINAIGFLSLAWADSFLDFLCYEALLGVGFSLISGSDLALLYDSEVYLAQRGGGGAGTSRSLSRLISIEAAASGLAGIGASLLLLRSLDWVIWVQAVTGLAPFLLGLGITEPPRPARRGSHRDNARQILELLLFSRPVVLWTALATVVFGLLALYAFWVYQKYWELQGIPLQSFGYIWAVFALVVSLAARYAGTLERRLGTRRLLLLLVALPLAGLLGMALLGGWAGAACGLLVQAARGLGLTVFCDALNRRVPGDFRATVNSLVSLATRAAFIASGPLLGLALDHLGMRTTLLSLVLLFAPLLLLVILPLIVRIRREPATASG